MSLNIQSMLDTLKRQALFTIMGNINITHHYLKEELNKYVNEGDTIFSSLLGKMKFDTDLISSSQTNAIYLLSYLDFYALYTILYANYPVFASLSDVSLKKYMYINSIYKDLIVMIKEKEISAENLNSMYINFMNTKNINFEESKLNSRENNNPPMLNTDILTLPIKSSRYIKPSSIIAFDSDAATHTVDNSSAGDEVIYSINRSQSSRIGIIRSVYAGKPNTSYSITPEVTGTIYGYFSNKILIEVTKIERDSAYAITKIFLKGSSNGTTWSDPFEALPGVATEVKIESNISIGLKILLYDNHPVLAQSLGLTVGDSWSIDISSIELPDPRIKCSIKFESMDFATYATYQDYSSFPLSDFVVKYKKRKYDTANEVENIYDRGIATVIPIADQASEIIIEATQKDNYISQVDDSLAYRFDFNLSNIALVSNEYEETGSVTFNGINVSNASMISLDSDYHIHKEGAYDADSTEQKSFIESNVIIQNSNDSITLPILNKTASDTVYEYIIPFEVNNNVAKFKTRLPSTGADFVVYNMFNGQNIDATYSDDVFTITNYNIQHGYSIQYKYKSTSFKDINDEAEWTKNGSIKPILYAYHRDTLGHNYILVRQENKDKLFSGNVKSFIEMRSSELPYITPMIFDYKIMCN